MKSWLWPSKTSGREILDLLIELTYLAVIFLVPLWFAGLFRTYNIFELNKAVLFQVLTAWLFLLTAVKLIFYSPNWTFPLGRFFKKYWLVPLIFIVGWSASLLSSTNPGLSFLGSYERQAGLLNYLYYFIWFILISFNLLTVNNHWSKLSRLKNDQPIEATNQPESVNRALITVALSGTVVAIYGILQIYKIDFLVWPEQPYLTHRALSTFGQPNFLASWLLLVIPVSLYLTFRRLGQRRRFFWSQLGWGCASVAQIVALFFTGSRGGLVAAGFSAVIFVLVYLARRVSSWRRRWLAIMALLLAGVIIGFGLNAFSGGRVKELLNFNYGSTGARVVFYQSAADAILKQPLLGYGLESGAAVFFSYYEPDWGIYGDVNQLTDRAHNLILDTLVTGGVVGLILVIVFWYFFFGLAKDNFKRSGKEEDFVSLALGLGVAAYLVSLMFSFTIISGEIYIWLYLAILIVINWRTANYPQPLMVEQKVSSLPGYPAGGSLLIIFKLILLIVALAATSFSINRSVRTLLADFYFNSTYFKLISSANFFEALTLNQYREENDTSQINRDYYNRFLAERLIFLSPSFDERVVKETTTKVLRNIDQRLSDRYYDNLLVKAKINRVLGEPARAQQYLARLIALSPFWPAVYLEQGDLAASEGDSEGAIVAYQLALFNVPLADDPRLNSLHGQVVKNYRSALNNRLATIYDFLHNDVVANKYRQAALSD
jgi:O-antigen ligase